MSDCLEAKTQFSDRKLSLKWRLEKWKQSPEYSQYLTDSSKAPKAILSPRFDTQGAGLWQIGFEFQFGGRKNGYKYGELHIYKLECKGSPTSVSLTGVVKISSLVSSDIEKKSTWKREEKVETAVSDCSWVAFLRDYLSKFPESLEISVEMTVGGWDGEAEMQHSSNSFLELTTAKGKQAILSDLSKLLENVEFADLTVTVEDRKMKAHRAILAARSPVLRAMLTCDMKERSEATITIKDTSAASWAIFLRFLYTEELDEGCELKVLLELMNMSDKYNVPSLMRHLETAVVKKMELDNVLEIYEVANQHGAERIKSAADKMIVRNWRSLRKDETDIVVAIPELASELLKQLKKLKLVNAWIDSFSCLICYIVKKIEEIFI